MFVGLLNKAIKLRKVHFLGNRLTFFLEIFYGVIEP